MSLLGSLFKTTTAVASKAINTPLDLAVYAGSLASNPTDIDPVLDRVRKITTVRTTNELSNEDNSQLLQVYLELERYLTTSDPIRTFTKDELRSRLSNELANKLMMQEMKGGV